jgi:hypothetical protein
VRRGTLAQREAREVAAHSSRERGIGGKGGAELDETYIGRHSVTPPPRSSHYEVVKTLAHLGLLALLLTAGRMEAITLTSSDVLRVSFRTSSSFGGSTPDTLEFYFYPGGFSAVGVTGYGAELYDGSTLLGSYHVSTSSVGIIAPLFKSSSSPATAATLVDFTTILNGTFNGRIDFHIDSGTATFNLHDFILWDATQPDGSGSANSGWVLKTVQIVAAPEPGSPIVLAISSIGLGLYRSRRRIAAAAR